MSRAARHDLARIALSAVVGYAVLLFLMRGLGKRTIAKMNMSDFVITVAIGSTLAGFIASRDIPILDGIVALAALVGVRAVVLEVDGNFTVIPRGHGGEELLGEAIGAPEDVRRRAS